MAKVLLVEDDNNLREIYEARLQAEGYDIVAARDGEEALVVAKGEMPDLVISDVMMPKISGFEMLDILRTTEGLKDVKVIMLTALGQAEDQTRAESLGADRYLVKSQVTLEDIVNAAKDLLGENTAATAPVEPVAAAPTPAAPSEPVQVTVTAAPPVEPVTAVVPAPVIPLATAPPEEVEVPEVSPQMPPTPASTVPDVTAEVQQVAPAPTAIPVTEPQTSEQEATAVEEQIASFVDSQTGQPAPTVEPVTEPADPIAPANNANTTTPEQDAVLADAVNTLSPPANSTAPAVLPVEPSADDVPAEPAKKVISPIVAEEGPAQKSIQELLSEEEAREAAANAPAPVATPAVEPVAESAPATTPETTAPTPAPQAPAAPAPQPAPAPVPAPTKPNGDFDPHSIAL